LRRWFQIQNDFAIKEISYDIHPVCRHTPNRNGRTWLRCAGPFPCSCF
jgi:hypothetical protein